MSAMVSRLSSAPSYAVIGDVYTFLATAATTNGQYALWHAVVPPGGGPPPHVHRREDEMFYVLEGEVSFFTEEGKTVAGPGTCLHLPRDRQHHFKNESSRPAKVLIEVVPAGLEKMFEEVGHPLPGPDAAAPAVTGDDIARLLAAAPRYGVEIKLETGS